jgi:ATP dependent DNA ligase domain
VGWLPLSDHQGRADVRFYSRDGAEYTNRLPRMAEAVAKLPTISAILDGELVLIYPGGAAHFYRLMAQMRTSEPDESQLMFLVFDLLHHDGVDLRGLPLSERKRDLDRLCRKSKVPFLKEVQTFPRWPGAIRALQQIWIRGDGQQAPGVALLERTKPQLGQDQVPGVEAHQRRALADLQHARANRAPAGTSEEARGARQGSGAAAIGRPTTGH